MKKLPQMQACFHLEVPTTTTTTVVLVVVVVVVFDPVLLWSEYASHIPYILPYLLWTKQILLLLLLLLLLLHVHVLRTTTTLVPHHRGTVVVSRPPTTICSHGHPQNTRHRHT